MRKNIEHLMDYSCLRVILGIEKFYTLKPLMDYNAEFVMFCRTCEVWQSAFLDKKYNEFIAQSENLCNQLESHPVLRKFQSHIAHYITLVLNEAVSSSASSDELRKLFQKSASQLLQTSGNERVVDSIIQYINEHYCDNLSTTILSEQFGLSSNYITNLLKQELGVRYNDYITQLRMDHAKELLLTTNESVKSITFACGYYSQSHFTKLFVEREGCTPIEYRKKSKY